MICGTCQKDIADASNFCYFCGARQQSAAASVVTPESGGRKLRRSATDKVFGGVCGGMGEYFDIDPVIIRVIWAVVAFGTGVGFLAYLICWIVIEQAPAGYVPAAQPAAFPARQTRQLRRSATNVKWAGVCGGIAEHFGWDVSLVRLAWAFLTVIPGAIVGGLLAYLIAWLVMPPPDYSSQNTNQPLPHSS